MSDLDAGVLAQKLGIKPERVEKALSEMGVPYSAPPAEPAEPVATIKALPTPHVPRQAEVDLDDWQGVTARPEDEIVIDVALGDGDAAATAYGCDLSYDYVKINGDYRS